MESARRAAALSSAEEPAIGIGNLVHVLEGMDPCEGEVQKGRKRTFLGALHPTEPWDRDQSRSRPLPAQ